MPVQNTYYMWVMDTLIYSTFYISTAVRSVTLNLANKFSQCTFSVTEHYDLFSGLIILRQAWWRRSYDVIPNRPQRTDRETAAGKAQRYLTDLKLIYMLSIMHYTTRRQFRVHGHFKTARNNRHHLYKTATPTRSKVLKNSLPNWRPI